MNSGLPPGWAPASFRDIAAPVSDKYTPRQSDADIRCVNLENLPEGAGRIVGHSIASENLSIKTAFKPGDVLFGKLRPYLRKYAQANFGGVCTTEIMAFRANELVDPRFLFHVVGSDAFIDHNVAVSFGTKMPRTDWRTAGDFQLQLPPLDEQRRIAVILSTLDKQIELEETQIQKQASVIVGLEQNFFPLCVESGPSSTLQLQIGEFADVLGGKRLPEGHDYSYLPTPFKYLRVTDFFAKSVALNGLKSLHDKTFKVLARYEIDAGDIYISIAGSIGYTGVMQTTPGLRVILTENAARIRINSKNVIPSYLSAYLNSQLGQRLISEKIGSGAGVPKLALDRIKQISVRLPSVERQSEVAGLLTKMREHLESEKLVVNKLRLQKQGLMRDLLTGRVRVDMGATCI